MTIFKSRKISFLAFIAFTFIFFNLCSAAGADGMAPKTSADKSNLSSEVVKERASTKRTNAGSLKLVDINSASKAALKTLPGIGDVEADKIVANRPYGSKGWLISHKIISVDKFPAIKDLIIAKQPYKDAVKNAAMYTNKK